MAKKVRKKELGLGIKALLNNMDTSPIEKPEEIVKELSSNVAEIPLEYISVNPFQPRTDFDPEALEELSNSIKVHGLIQPITVRRLSKNEFQLISGERRLRASKLAGLTEVPAYVRLANDQEMLEMALVENIQRQELNAIEIGITYLRLKEECNLTQEQLAERVGKKRSSVANYMLLLELPPEIQKELKQGNISMGHARALRKVDDVALQLSLIHKIKEEDLSVRAIEDLVRSLKAPKTPKPSAPTLSDDHQNVENQLCAQLETKVVLKTKGNGKGQIVINFTSDEDLNRILDIIEGE